MSRSKKSEPVELDGFVLTRDYRESPLGIELELWLATDVGAHKLVIREQRVVCFTPRSTKLSPADYPGFDERRPLELCALTGEPVDGLYFRSQRQLRSFRDWARAASVTLYESDIAPTERYLMERFVTGGARIIGVAASSRQASMDARLEPSDYTPKLCTCAIDIETDARNDRLLSIAAAIEDDHRVLLLRDSGWSADPVGDGVELSIHDHERHLLDGFLDWVATRDPDLIVGWNVIEFDLADLERRCRSHGLDFALGRGGSVARVHRGSGERRRAWARVPGRLVIDGIEGLRTAGHGFEDFSLEAVARELLARGKRLGDGGESPLEGLDKIDEIRRLHREEPEALIAYNIEDCRLVLDIFTKARLVEFLIRRAQLTGLALDRPSASMAAFDNLYLPRLHRRGRVAPDVDPAVDFTPSPGGHVMESEPGLHENVVVLDFKSLYPSIIRTFLVDPLGLRLGLDEPDDANPVPGFVGAAFSREQPILPALINELWRARDQAKARDDRPSSTAIKVIMNSFYGVMGSPACRFFDPRLASSITMRGHEILQRSREFIEARGFPVIYGDTDSLFVMLGAGMQSEHAHAVGRDLEAGLNDHWRETLAEQMELESQLELEFETLYRKFFMPTLRGSTRGSKKRYAGLVETDHGLELRIRGMESVRSDWTELARGFQREIFRRVFLDLPYEDYVRETVATMRSGSVDDKLVYRKRLRKPLDSYIKNVPPHVQAARKLVRPKRWIRYVLTATGPEPVEANPGRLDYDHYLERQLAPAVDPLLSLLGTSVADIVDEQLSMFEA